MRLLRFALLFLLLTPFTGNRLGAWDADGHQIVATIAWQHLTPQTQKIVAEMVREMQAPGHPYNEVSLACWMDDLRKPDSGLPCQGLFLSWHYIDLGIEAGDPQPSWEPGDDNERHGNVVQALKRAVVVLQGGADPYIKSKAMACAMVMHLVGDIHQPLHAATHYFRSHGSLQQDNGGNREEVVNGPAENPRFSLHAFWDSAWRASFDEATGRVVLDERYQDSGTHDPARVRAVADRLMRIPPPDDSDEFHSGAIDTWARESNQLADVFAYRAITATESPKYCRLSSGYVSRARETAGRQLVLAGYRLAFLLNVTLGAPPSSKPPASYPAGPSR